MEGGGWSLVIDESAEVQEKSPSIRCGFPGSLSFVEIPGAEKSLTGQKCHLSSGLYFKL